MKKLLIVHTGGGLGDVLLAAPLIDAVHETWPECEVDFLARRSTAPAVETHEGLHKLLVMDNSAPKLGEIWGWAKRLRAEKYDAACVLWSKTNLAFMLYLARMPVRVGQDSRFSYSWTYTHKVKVRSEHGDTHSHWSDILMDYVRAIGVNPVSIKYGFKIKPEAKEKAAQLLQELPQGEGPIIGFHSSKGMKLDSRRWPVEVFASWAAALHKELGARLIYTGSAGEAELVGEVQKLAGVPALNLAGRTNVQELAAVSSMCRVFVCPDSGPMHLACLSGTPTVGVYALEEDFPERWAPVGAPSRKVRPNPTGCPPGCIKGKCPDFRCYKSVTPGMVVNAVKELLEM